MPSTKQPPKGKKRKAPPRPEQIGKLLRALELHEKGQLDLDRDLEPAPRTNGKPAKRTDKHAVHYSAERGDWPTPVDFVQLLVELFGTIDLDPCSNAESIVPAIKRYTGPPHADGLAEPWAIAKGRPTTVYVNPPYGESCGRWTERCVESWRAGCEVVLLVPSRTDLPWWHRDVATATAVGFWRGRIKFHGASSGAPFPSAVAYWGERGQRFARIFGRRCLVWGRQTAGSLPGTQLGLWAADA